MLKIYELKLNNVEYWEKINLPQEGEVFVRKTGGNFSLYLDRYRKLDGGYNYIDMISGRVIYTKEDNDFIQIFYPYGVIIPKENMIRIKDKLDLIAEIVEKKEEEYTLISDNVLFYSAICNKISKETMLDVIRVSLVKEELKIKNEDVKRTRTKG